MSERICSNCSVACFDVYRLHESHEQRFGEGSTDKLDHTPSAKLYVCRGEDCGLAYSQAEYDRLECLG